MAEKKTLVKKVECGEWLTLDGGRIKIKVKETTRRDARIVLVMDEDVDIGKDRPGMAEIAKRGIS